MEGTESDREVKRLEDLWSGTFGDAYVDRNAGAYDLRGPFWRDLVARLAPTRVLEVGCNTGGNLRWIAPLLEPAATYGVDINRKALTLLHEAQSDVNALIGSAKDLPFRDEWFDLVFTMGVLIHQPDDSLRDVIREMARCSSTHLLCGEYFADEVTEVAYRGVPGALFKRDYGRLFLEAVPGLALLDSGHLTAEEGFDDITWWLFKKP
jgi:pseudaminic acid biosynthesis-associated methylase